MINVLYIGDTIIIRESATHGTISYKNLGKTRHHLLEWEELHNAYRDAIKNDTNGRFYNEEFKKEMEK